MRTSWLKSSWWTGPRPGCSSISKSRAILTPTLPQRMFVYYYCIFDRYGVDVVSLAVCTDVLPASHIAPYQRARWGCELTFRFPVV